MTSWYDNLLKNQNLVQLSSSASSCVPDKDSNYIHRLKNSYQITNALSNVQFLYPDGTMCIRVPTNTQNTPVLLDKCSNHVEIHPMLSTNTPYISDSGLKFYDDYMYLDNNGVLYSATDVNGCLEVKSDHSVVFTTDGCDGKNDRQRFKVIDKNNSIKNIATGKCLTASGFTNNSLSALGSGKSSSLSTPITVGECPSSYSSTITAYDSQNDSIFQFGMSTSTRGMNGVIQYSNLAQMYDVLKNADKLQFQQMIDEKNQEIQKLNNELTTETNLYNEELQINTALLKAISGNQSQFYEIIGKQTNTIHQNIQQIQQNKINEVTLNKYQLEQNQQIQYIHKILFWIYFVVAFIFLIVFFATKLASFDFWSLFIWSMLSIVVIIYPFVILFIEYGFVFSFYYVVALMLGKPFVMNKLPPTNSIFFTP